MTAKLSYEQLEKQNEELREQLRFYQEHDALTGLLNKDAFYAKTRKKLNAFSDKRWQIICIDIRHFKLINDLYGSEEGDSLLKYIAGQLEMAFEKDLAVLSRIAADVYAVFLPLSVEKEDIERRITSIFESYPLDSKIIPAVGVYEIADLFLPVELMCDRAVLALNTIKGDYTQTMALYDTKMRKGLIEEYGVLNEAEDALKRGEFEFYLQPKCSMYTGKVIGAEALIRWNHPERGLIPPNEFIPAFEKSGFIKTLDRYMWDEVGRWMRCCLDRGYSMVPVSVNVSRIDARDMDVFNILCDIIGRYGLNPALLEIEITESAYINQPDQLIHTIENLMRSGFTVSMDDFGSGYSSLNMLKDITIDILKLDMRFLDNDNRKSRDILESIIHMAKWLNLGVIAEGVETKKQVDFLKAAGCGYAQGYYYYKPMPAPEFEKLLVQEDKIELSSGIRTDAERAEIISFKDLFHKDAMTDQLLNNILGGIAIFKYDGKELKILQCNEFYYNIVFHKEIPKNSDIRSGLENLADKDINYLIQAFEDARETGDDGQEVYVRRRATPTELIWLRFRIFYLSKINGNGIYYVAVNDVTERMEDMENLQLSRQRLEMAMDAASATLFEVDIATRVARYAKHSQEEFGLDDCVPNAPEGFIEQGSVCPGYEDIFRNTFYNIYNGADKAFCVIQAKMGDGSIVWNKITLMAIKDSNQKSVNAIGIVENVTREKERENLKSESIHKAEG